MSGYTGAEIHGVDLRQEIPPEVVSQIRQALLKWRVLFFRDQPVSQSQHVAFGRLFGELTPAHPTLPAVFEEFPEILLLDNKGAEEAEGVEHEHRWHTDVTFLPDPPMASILRSYEVPAYGGDTQWTNLAVAYERLSPPVQRLVDTLHAVHGNVLHVARGEVSELQKRFQMREIRAVHPVVRVHPETGEKVLFVNPGFTLHIVELTRRESANLLALLYEHLSHPSLTVRFHWRADCIAFWDNRATAHLVPSDVLPGNRRSMQRITIAGDVPVGPDGSRSYAMSA